MLTQQEREEIKMSIAVNTAQYGDGAPANVFSSGSKFSLHDVSRLLDDLDKTEQEVERLKVLVGKLYKIVNLASLTKCDHKCFTKKTQRHLLALLEESRAVVEQRKVS